jgi:acyl-coenzyme A synthetase/AMP-(fatty) acid ligase
LNGTEVVQGEPGELALCAVHRSCSDTGRSRKRPLPLLRDGWYFSGDIVRCDADGFYYVLDRSKEMIKYKGFPVAPAEVESVLLEHAAVRDCGVVAKPDLAAGEIPCAFVVLRDGFTPRMRWINNCAASSPTAWPTTNSRARFTLWKRCQERPRAKFCAASCARF